MENVGPEPAPRRRTSVERALQAVRKANRDGDTDHLRELWPLSAAAHSATGRKRSSCRSSACSATVPYWPVSARPMSAAAVRLIGHEVEEHPDIGFFGRCPRRRFRDSSKNGRGNPRRLARACRSCAAGRPAWRASGCREAPRQAADAHRADPVSRRPAGAARVDRQRFRTHRDPCGRLLPTEAEIREFAGWSLEKYRLPHARPVDGTRRDFAFRQAHRGGFAGRHAPGLRRELLRRGRRRNDERVSSLRDLLRRRIDHRGQFVPLLQRSDARTELLPGLETDCYQEDARVPILEDGARVYTGISRNDEFIVGDAGGYIRAFGFDGEFRWRSSSARAWAASTSPPTSRRSSRRPMRDSLPSSTWMPETSPTTRSASADIPSAIAGCSGRTRPFIWSRSYGPPRAGGGGPGSRSCRAK